MPAPVSSSFSHLILCPLDSGRRYFVICICMRLWVGALVVVAGVGVRRLIPTAAASGDLYALLGASPAASDADLKK